MSIEVDLGTRFRSCEMKRRYVDAEAAEAGRKEANRHTGRYLRTYQCPLCAGWHLSKTRKRIVVGSW